MDQPTELIDRVRRIETRVTKIGRHFGIDVGGGKPVWFGGEDNRVVLPSPNCSVGDVLKVIPEAERGHDVDVYVGQDYLFTLFIDP